MVCNAFVSPFDFQCLFMNMFAGSPDYFGIIALIALVLLTAYLRMSSASLGISVLLFSIMFYDQVPWLLYPAIIVTGLLIGYNIFSIIKR